MRYRMFGPLFFSVKATQVQVAVTNSEKFHHQLGGPPRAANIPKCLNGERHTMCM